MYIIQRIYNYIISSSGSDEEKIKVWDFKGNKLEEINNSKERTGFIDNYYSPKNDKYYIIIANYGNIKSYDFEFNELYKTYKDDSEEINDHGNFVIYDKDEELNNILILIDSCYDGYIRLWDFHNEDLLKKIKCCKMSYQLRNICLNYDQQYLFIVCEKENSIKIIDLTQKKVITSIKVKNNELLMVKSINHHIYGNCILTKGILDDNITLWTP